MGRQDRRNEDQRIKIEKQAHGIAEFVISFGLGLDEQKEEKRSSNPWVSLRKFCMVHSFVGSYKLIQ